MTWRSSNETKRPAHAWIEALLRALGSVGRGVGALTEANPGVSIALAVAVGAVAARYGAELLGTSCWSYDHGALSSSRAWWPQYVCKPMATQGPPWTLLSALAAVPPVLLTWYWRTRHRAKEVDTAEARSLTDRYQGAVMLLADERQAARLGAIYALERIAIDSAKDLPTVCSTLCAFVRFGGDTLTKTDAEAALGVLGSLNSKSDECRINLNYAKVRDVVVPNLDLRGASLLQAEFTRCNFYGIDLRHADGFNMVFLDHCQLSSGKMQGLFAPKSKWDGTTLDDAQFQCANLTNAAFTRSPTLVRADLSGARLNGTDFAECALVRTANLKGATFLPSTTWPAEFSDEDARAAGARPYSSSVAVPAGPDESG